MNCPHGGFLRLEFLQMQGMWSLKDLLVEEEVMSNLKTLKIEYCDKMRKFPHGLLQLKKLQRLNLYHISQALMSEVLETRGEDWNRIRLITSQTHPISDNTSFILLDDTGFHWFSPRVQVHDNICMYLIFFSPEIFMKMPICRGFTCYSHKCNWQCNIKLR